MDLHPNVSYHPVPGLVALFARAASCTRNPRAPHTHPHATTGFSYTIVVKSPMENGKFNDGNRGYNQQYGGRQLGKARDKDLCLLVEVSHWRTWGSIRIMVGADPTWGLVAAATMGAIDQEASRPCIALVLSDIEVKAMVAARA
jgi:hypothetical protein